MCSTPESQAAFLQQKSLFFFACWFKKRVKRDKKDPKYKECARDVVFSLQLGVVLTSPRFALFREVTLPGFLSHSLQFVIAAGWKVLPSKASFLAHPKEWFVVGSAGSASVAHRAAVVLASLLPAGFGRSQNPRDVGERLQSASDVLLVARSACDSVREHKPRC